MISRLEHFLQDCVINALIEFEHQKLEDKTIELTSINATRDPTDLDVDYNTGMEWTNGLTGKVFVLEKKWKKKPPDKKRKKNVARKAN